ncbi:hypothetical protein L2E82_50747 [Cichorium intybus]|nr:hypothetical protein L2E82_50747 [Cichorium intybus]
MFPFSYQAGGSEYGYNETEILEEEKMRQLPHSHVDPNEFTQKAWEAILNAPKVSGLHKQINIQHESVILGILKPKCRITNAVLTQAKCNIKMLEWEIVNFMKKESKFTPKHCLFPFIREAKRQRRLMGDELVG